MYEKTESFVAGNKKNSLLNYSELMGKLSGRGDSNTRPLRPERSALANCATSRFPKWDCKYSNFF